MNVAIFIFGCTSVIFAISIGILALHTLELTDRITELERDPK